MAPSAGPPNSPSSSVTSSTTAVKPRSPAAAPGRWKSRSQQGADVDERLRGGLLAQLHAAGHADVGESDEGCGDGVHGDDAESSHDATSHNGVHADDAGSSHEATSRPQGWEQEQGQPGHSTFTVHSRSVSCMERVLGRGTADGFDTHGSPTTSSPSFAQSVHDELRPLLVRRRASEVLQLHVSPSMSHLPAIVDEPTSKPDTVPASPPAGSRPASSDQPGKCSPVAHSPAAGAAADGSQSRVASPHPEVQGRSDAGALDAAARASRMAFSPSSVGGGLMHEPMQSFAQYLAGEASPREKLPSTDVVWGQTERERVYNFLLYVPYQLERLIQFSLLLCVDVFVGVMTLLPLRSAIAMARALRAERTRTPQHDGRRRLGGSQIFDILVLLILSSATVSLRAIRPGFIYYWLKDITNEFLKMSVLVSLFEIADKILSNFGLDVMEALSGTCTQWALGAKRLRHVAADAAVAFVVVLLHAVTLMCQALVLAVALNSHRNGLLGLLIASNFVEIKGTVFKRWDVERIRALTKMDVVERFQLLAILFFIIVEDMDSSSTWVPSTMILRESLRILGAEVVIDIVKHAVVGKFNDVRPGIYKEYMRDLCDEVCSSQSHNLHKVLGFHHLACSALVLRSLVSLFWLKLDAGVSGWVVAARAAIVLCCWLVLLGAKLLFGYALKLIAHSYVTYFNASARAGLGLSKAAAISRSHRIVSSSKDTASGKRA